MRLKLVALVVLVAVGVGAVAFASGAIGASAANTPTFLTANATVGDVTDEVAATGTLAAAESYGLLFGADPYLVAGDDTPASEGTWPVTAVEVDVGDTVAEGDILATADTADLQRDLATATADLRSANINLAIAEDRVDDADDDDDDTDTDAERQAQLGLYSAQNQVAKASADRGDDPGRGSRPRPFEAPIAGVVTEVNVRGGLDAPAGRPSSSHRPPTRSRPTSSRATLPTSSSGRRRRSPSTRSTPRSRAR